MTVDTCDTRVIGVCESINETTRYSKQGIWKGKTHPSLYFSTHGAFLVCFRKDVDTPGTSDLTP